MLTNILCSRYCQPTIDIWGRIIFGVGGHPAHCRVLSNTSGLELLDASSTPPSSCDNRNVSWHCQMPLGGRSPLVETYGSRGALSNRNCCEGGKALRVCCPVWWPLATRGAYWAFAMLGWRELNVLFHLVFSLCFACFKKSLLRYNPHTIQFTQSKESSGI